MNGFKKSLAVLMTASTLAACSKQAVTSHSSTTNLNSAAILADQTLSPADKAEKLALAGEQLTTPTGFMYADMVFDQALAQDSTNKRAQFYKAFLATPMATRGILARVKTLALSDPKANTEYNQIVAHLPNSALKTFLLAGNDDIRTEKDIQTFADSLYQAQDKFRIFLKNNKNLEMTLNLNDWALQSQLKKALNECEVTQTAEGSYKIQQCDFSKALQYQMNRADI
jgi:hypothetical protein